MFIKSPAVLLFIIGHLVCVIAYYTDCGGQLTDQAGSLLSPSIQGNYPNNARCTWTITVADGQVIDLRFKTLDLDRIGDQQCFDYVEIFDGLSSSDLLLGRPNCGFASDANLVTLRFRSTSNKMFVQFTSDASGTRTGFTASYWAHECPPLTYGDEVCNTTCQCNKEHTNYCDSLTGKCYCKSGWTSSDCSTLNDYCTDPNNCPDPYGRCVNTPVGFQCLCNEGMKLENGSCKDAKNCTNRVCSHACGVTPLAPHTETCYCPKGMKFNTTDGSSCQDCEDWRYGESCLHSCNCVKDKTLSCNKTNGLCNCRSNWQGPRCNEDVDECNLPRRPCNTSEQCYNTAGSYQCLCFPGYENPSGLQCEECGQIMNETFGQIYSGRHASIKNFTKYDECSWTILAPYGAVVSLSFQYFDLRGSSDDGFLEIYDITNTSSKFLENVHNPPPGRIIRTTGNAMHIVRVPARWYSSEYGYQSAGFNATYWTHSCEPFMFNENCTAPCKCIQNNTLYCNSTTGECLCSDGWYGSHCSFDINECSSPTLCPDYSTCQNLPGSYECKCKEGLKMNQSNICILDNESASGCQTRNCSHICVSLTNQSTTLEKCYCPNGMELVDDQCIKCRFWKYGPDCERDCTCDVSKTVHCDSVDGSCYCWSNWTGIKCENDFDECRNNKYNCTANSDCKNINGSYECPCRGQDGYLPYENGTCYHIDCTYDLSNTSGEIKSPQYSSHFYINNADCSWKITAEKNQVISLWFTEFSTDTYNYCQNDYLKVYDGVNESNRVIGHYCGNGVPNVIRSSGDHMYIVFRSDQYMQYTGGIVGIYKSHECQGFTYGTHSCDNKCQCVKENTASCINTNGECVCKPGWKSRDCSVDVNECLGTNNKVCPPNSDCINTVGSYRCDCHRGYQWDTASQTCYESKECMYKKCSHTCYILQPGVEQCACPDDMELDRSMGLVCFVPLYPYGIDAEDRLLENAYNIFGSMYVTPPIFVSSGAPFGNSVALSLHISSSGAVGFGDGKFNYSLFTDVNIQVHNSESIIAPFMTHINPQTGHVYYHLYEHWGEIFSDSEMNQKSPNMSQVVTRAAKDIKEYYSMSDFEAETVIITTWEDVEPSIFPRDVTQTNTFQAIYISGWEIRENVLSEEKTAYVIYLYHFGKMNWAYTLGRPIIIGVSGPMTQMFGYSNTPLVSLLDQIPGNIGRNGVLSFQVGRVDSNRMCYNHLYRNIDLLTSGRYHQEINELYKCPSTLERQGAQWEHRQIKDDEMLYCFVIKPIAKRRFLSENRRNKICCYNQVKPKDESWNEWYKAYREAFYLSGHVLIADPNDYSYLAHQNILAEQKCCADGRYSKSCKRFYKLFPDMGSTDFAEFVSASALGDPHILSLDGLNYTMNGWGEFVLLEVSSENFTLQARTNRYETRNGIMTNATVFTAFAARESNKSFFQAELSYSNRTMVLKANDVDVTRSFYMEGNNLIMSDEYLSVIKEKQGNKTQVVVAFPCGVTFKIHVAFKSLLIEVNVIEGLINKTKGLLGNYNRNKIDDFTLPDGSILPNNISEKEIYEHFAKTWRTNSSTSVFQYEQGKSTADYQHVDFTPFYLDSVNKADRVRAEELCGQDQYACIFDYLVTGSQDFSLNTKQTTGENILVSKTIGNHPPSIILQNNTLDSSGRWVVKNGWTSSIQIVVEDRDHDAVTFEVVGAPTGVVINQTGFLTYLPNYKKPITLRVRVSDSKGSYSPLLYIPVTICSMCNDHGNCSSLNIRENLENGLFQIQACECYAAYTGLNCESELDACAMNPCYRGQTCIDLTADQQGNDSVGYRCGPCPKGFRTYQQTCVDINECNETNPCGQLCTNTEGSYHCSCHDGYRLSYDNHQTCVDINECEERTSGCEHVCYNTEGNYTCGCFSLYALDSDGKTCKLASSDVSILYHCEQIFDYGLHSKDNCTCKIGYELDPGRPTFCNDIDECQYGNKPCSQNCLNLPGSYQCTCYTGYRLSKDGVTCEACQQPNFGVNCSFSCQCNGRGTCDPVRGCLCNEQWTGVNCENDVNECDEPNVCRGGMVCQNTVGSYKCLCPMGYKHENNICSDIDECHESLMNMTCDFRAENCVNNVGSYACECKMGYSRNNLSLCVDIDECDNKIDDCEHICENIPGTYNCLCHEGYVLGDDGRACNRIKNMCESYNLNCSYGCKKNNLNVFECYCPKGYKLNSLGICKDINECQSENENMCAHISLCTNTNGSYNCSCRAGFKLDNDGRSCLACSSSTWGINCAKSCACMSGADQCSPVNGCICKNGYTGTYCEIDIDECANGAMKCENKEKCANLPGTATCVCQEGYKRINKTCEDIDECSDTSTHNCSQLCNNFEGGFVCSCFTGYTYNRISAVCEDIDECDLGMARCEQKCINTEGSYRCACITGLVLQNDGLTCRATLECSGVKNCSYKCSSNNATENCYCPKGQILAEDLENCNDINLCENQHCSFGCVETEFNTSYKCLCGEGQYLASNEIDCLDCVEGTWGQNCMNTCNCTAANTFHCNIITGTCLCKPGWTGLHCENDIDECTLNMYHCPAHSHCMNKGGGYSCNCDDGFIRKLIDGTCEECDDNYYGPSCALNCSCEGHSNCSKVNGSCYCKPEWTGHTCEIDVNECDLGTHQCDIRKHEKCLNKHGGYECVCVEGYMKSCDTCDCGAISNHDVTVSFNYDVTYINLDDKVSDDYRNLLKEVQNQLTASLRSSITTVISVTTISLRRGSLITENQIILNSTDENKVQLNFFIALRETLINGVQLFDEHVSLLNITANGYEVTRTTCMCVDFEVCELEEDKIICRSKGTDKKGSMNLILGLAIGLPLFAILCVIVIIACRQIKKKGKDYQVNSLKRATKIEEIRRNKENIYDSLDEILKSDSNYM